MGDCQVESVVNIDKPEQEGEIGIVGQLESLNTNKMLLGIKRERA